MSSQGGVLPRGVVSARWVSAWGCVSQHALPRGCLPQCMLGYPPPPVNRITDTRENITLPQLRSMSVQTRNIQQFNIYKTVYASQWSAITTWSIIEPVFCNPLSWAVTSCSRSAYTKRQPRICVTNPHTYRTTKPFLQRQSLTLR